MSSNAMSLYDILGQYQQFCQVKKGINTTMTEHTTPNRIFKIGATTIQVDATMANLDNEEIRAILKRTYPEVTHATIRERTLEDGTTVLDFIPVAGRKG